MKRSLHTSPACYLSSHGAYDRVSTSVCNRRYHRSGECNATPHPRTFRAILSCGFRRCASHVRTDRPHPPTCGGLGLARETLRPPVASLPSRGFTPHAPVRGAFALPRPIDRGFATGPHQGASPLEPDKGYRALDHSPETIASRHPRPELARSGRRAGGFHAPAPWAGGPPSTRRRTRPAERRRA